MFQKFSVLPITALLLGAMFAFNACKKDTSEEQDKAKASEAALAVKGFQFFNAAFNMANRGTEAIEGLQGNQVDDRTDTCGTVTVTPADLFTYPKIVVVDFGTGCTDGDGKYKTGKVTMIVGKPWEPNSTLSFAYDNYTEDGVALNGTFTFLNKSNANGAIFEIQASNLKVTDLNQVTTTYNAIQTYTQIAGAASWWTWADDVYAVTGVIDAENTNGDKAKWTITDPLIKANNCPWVSKGSGTLTYNADAYVVDYGNGSCDNQATLTFNGQSYPITL